MAWAAHLKVPRECTNPIGIRFVLIPPGVFLMGSPDREKGRQSGEFEHSIRITMPFYLGMCEVTQAEYKQVMASNPSEFKEYPTNPVERVSWEEAVDFCRRLPQASKDHADFLLYRLPTEAEWEYACRAGTENIWYGTDDLEELKGNAWFSDNALGTTHPVRQKRANAWGLYDMHGNVAEWCQDWWSSDYYRSSPPDDPPGPTADRYRVIRGGSWADDAIYCRSAYREMRTPNSRLNQRGFRVVADPAAGWLTPIGVSRTSPPRNCENVDSASP